MRQLAAIVFVDMTGYTALMHHDEEDARKKRRRLKEVLEATVARFNGRVLQYYGDGSLTLFNSAIDAARASISMQQQLRQEPAVDVRIGIHTGDVTIDEDAIYGDGVNLASRIESLGVAGGILISEKVADELRNQAGIITREMGWFEFKNVDQAIRVFAIANDGLIVPSRQLLRGKTAQTSNRLAVLPFVNMSADPENEYFSDGITEELLNSIAKVDEIKVTSRTSSFAFKGKNSDIRDIAIQLNVDKVLEGSVRKSGNRVRITAQLINASDGYHIWSETYDRDLTDIFAVQDEISATITNKLRQNFSAKEETVARPPVRNMEAYTCYLKGLHYWNKLTPADARRCISCCEEAIGVEPQYAQAHALIAGAYSYLGASGQMSPKKAFEKAHYHADRALELDDTIAESHIAKGSAYLFYDWEWDKAYSELQKALELNPAAVDVYELLAFYYVCMGEKERAIKVMEEAERIDPLSPAVSQALGNMYLIAGRYDDVIRQANKVLEVYPDMRICIELKAWAIGMPGNWEGALQLFEEVYRLTGHPLKGLMGLGYALGKLGRREEAMECIARMEQRQREEPEAVIDGDLTSVWHALGNMDKVFYHINQCIEKRMAPAIFFLEFLPFEDVKNDPRYLDIRKKLNLA